MTVVPGMYAGACDAPIASLPRSIFEDGVCYRFLAPRRRLYPPHIALLGPAGIRLIASVTSPLTLPNASGDRLDSEADDDLRLLRVQVQTAVRQGPPSRRPTICPAQSLNRYCLGGPNQVWASP